MQWQWGHSDVGSLHRAIPCRKIKCNIGLIPSDDPTELSSSPDGFSLGAQTKMVRWRNCSHIFMGSFPSPFSSDTGEVLVADFPIAKSCGAGRDRFPVSRRQSAHVALFTDRSMRIASAVRAMRTILHGGRSCESRAGRPSIHHQQIPDNRPQCFDWSFRRNRSPVSRRQSASDWLRMPSFGR
jgi:hypothetical protein